ncbi:MAG: TrmH family RNA methyltransferase [Pseudomonadota bacterium]
MAFYAYLLRCSNGAYYAGHTDDLEARIGSHQSGLIEGYTRRHLPVTLVWSQDFPDRAAALDAEKQIKGWSRAKKEALIRGDFEGLQYLSRKLFLRYAASTSSAATQDKRDGGQTNALVLSSFLSEGEDRLSMEGEGSGNIPLVLSSGPSEAEGRVSKDPAVPPIIILVRPQLGQNIGKAARAMLNFGLTDLRIVAPRDGWPNPDAGPAASGADIVLEKATIHASVADAVADCSQVFATTVRRRDIVLPVVGPAEMAEEIHASTGRTAILFGPERSGLETEDVALARKIVTVPINPEFGSLNLAQAVILLAYEWSRAERLAQPTFRETEPPASQFEVEGLVGQMDEALSNAGFYYPADRTEVTRLNLRTMLTKPGWSSREVRAMRGMLRSIAKGKRR